VDVRDERDHRLVPADAEGQTLRSASGQGKTPSQELTARILARVHEQRGDDPDERATSSQDDPEGPHLAHAAEAAAAAPSGPGNAPEATARDARPSAEAHGEEPAWVLTGPTAGGKTAAALALADRLASRGERVEILSMDSMAVFRRMDIGTAKPDPDERAAVPHHLIDLVEPHEPFDTARWCAEAERVLREVRARGARPLFVGGTPLYLMAFFKGLIDGVPADPELRDRLEREEATRPGALHERLREVDPVAAARIHPNDTKRQIRALEVFLRTGKPISEQQDTFDRPGFVRPCRIVALAHDRDALRARVKTRTERMLARGLVEETRAIRDGGGFGPQSVAAIGYAECLLWLQRRLKDEEELRNRIRRSTHRLIRRQETWLRRLREIRWLRAEDVGPARLEELFRTDPVDRTPGRLV
jgi:tRNA dimethylallyltransferase